MSYFIGCKLEAIKHQTIFIFFLLVLARQGSLQVSKSFAQYFLLIQ